MENLDKVDTTTETEDVAAARSALTPSETTARAYLRSYLDRVKGGESGVLPVVAGLLLVSVIFQSANSNFLTAGNLVNLLVQAAVFSLLAMGMVFVLLLGEIDLSAGFVSGVGGVIMAELVKPLTGWPWWAAIAAGLITCAAIGLLQGSLITRIGLPAFIVTLGGLLFWQGVMIKIVGEGGSLLIQDDVVNNIASGNLAPWAGWVLMLVIVGIYALTAWRHDYRRRAAGLVAPPPSVTLAKSVAALLGGVALVLLCNADRGRLVPVRGVPWVIILVFAVLALWTYVLGRTKFGRYVYAIGGNIEAARRAGINTAWIRTAAFGLCSLTAGIAGVVYASRLRSVSTALDGGTLVLYAVAAAVIGGTSLFGGRGKALAGVMGGIVIAAIDNGMGLLGFDASTKYMVTALVLLIAVTIDALSRRGKQVAR
jgi:D-xylose transport system permease protein